MKCRNTHSHKNTNIGTENTHTQTFDVHIHMYSTHIYIHIYLRAQELSKINAYDALRYPYYPYLPMVSISFLEALLTMADALPANSRVLLVSANCESAGDTHASITAARMYMW